MSPALATPDRQDTYKPRWLVDVAISSYFEPRKFATNDLPTTLGFYHGRLLNDPEPSVSFVNTFWGFTEVSRVRVRLANHDNALNAIYTGDPRNRVLVLRRYDETAGLVEVSFTGKIIDAVMGVGVLELEATAPDLRIFEQEIPKGLVDATTFPNAIDAGAAFDLVVGNVVRKQLPYVLDDTTNNIYDYLLGRGSITATAFYRDGPDGTLHTINASEYTIVYGAYGNATVVRFTNRQVNFQNGFHKIYADVTGLSAERNFVRAIRTLLSNTSYGLGETINAASFDAAEAQLDPVTGTAVTGLYCDGVFRPQQAQDVLRDLLMIRGMRLAMNADGEWTITVDTEQTTEKLHLQDGTGDGERTLLAIRGRRRRAAPDMVSDYVLRFRTDDLQQGDASPRLEVRRTVNTAGREKIVDHPYIRDTTTADKVVYYLATREKHGSETVECETGQEGRTLLPGDLVRLTYAPMAFSAQTMEVRRVVKRLGRVALLLGTWTADFYGYSAGALPTEPTIATPTYDPRALKKLIEPEVFTGLSTMTEDKTIVVVDEGDDEADFIFVQGTDIHWGESSYTGTVITASSAKFVGEDPAYLSACYDMNGAIHLASSQTGIDSARWAKLGRNGDVLQAFTGKFVAPGALVFTNVAICYHRGLDRIYWAMYASPGWLYGATTDRDGVIKTNLSVIRSGLGAVTLPYLFIQADSSNRVHLLYQLNPSSTPEPRWERNTQSFGNSGFRQQTLAMPKGISNVNVKMFHIDDDDLLHVLATDGVGPSDGTTLMYGRLSTDGDVLVPFTPFAIGSYGIGGAHASKWRLFAPKIAATALSLLRIEAVPIDKTTSGLFVGAAL